MYPIPCSSSSSSSTESLCSNGDWARIVAVVAIDAAVVLAVISPLPRPCRFRLSEDSSFEQPPIKY